MYRKKLFLVLIYIPFSSFFYFFWIRFSCLSTKHKTTRFKSNSQWFSLKLTAPSALSNSSALSENLQNPIRIYNSLQFSPLRSTSSQNHTTFTFKIIALDFINKIVGNIRCFLFKKSLLRIASLSEKSKNRFCIINLIINHF